MPNITINGKTIEVEEGTTIIEAYKQLGEEIAHYCWHPGLTVAGVCRLCMVEVEGNPRLQIACNTPVQEGMVVHNNSDKVKEVVKWGLDFHLINHPLDCPICDQAGECGLQNQYMQFGKYDPEMAENKVKKRKVVDLGERVVLDTERCILCSRCVRFTSEVSKTNELGIFNRGDRSEIGTFDDKPLNNNYSLNTVDICPVGALTSKDFRFKQRVWYLQDEKTVCPGCSTGCNVRVYFNEEGLFRVKPEHNPEVNGYWMCDKGRDTYKQVNRRQRLPRAKVFENGVWEQMDAGAAAKKAGAHLRKCSPDKVAFVLTGQYTNEEFDVTLKYAVEDFGCKNIYHWMNNPSQEKEFDGLLFRGDRNPNTAGLRAELKKRAVTTQVEDLMKTASSYDLIVVAGPENLEVYPDLQEKVKAFGNAKSVIWLTADKSEVLDQFQTHCWLIPQKTFVEKRGTFTNFAGQEQRIEVITTIVPGALNLEETVTLLSGQELKLEASPQKISDHMKENYFVHQRGRL